MRFSGYWVSADRDKPEVTAGEFDDTELSDHSDWQEAWQNEDPELAHGFLDPLTMLHDISKRITGEIDPAELHDAAIRFQAGTPCQLGDLQDLARLIQLLIPKALPRSPKGQKSPTPVGDEADDLPL
jgi:hypothetical protein